jgi:hypothetical protein
LRYYWYSSTSSSNSEPARTGRGAAAEEEERKAKSLGTIFKEATGEKDWIMCFVAEILDPSWHAISFTEIYVSIV